MIRRVLCKVKAEMVLISKSHCKANFLVKFWITKNKRLSRFLRKKKFKDPKEEKKPSIFINHKQSQNKNSVTDKDRRIDRWERWTISMQFCLLQKGFYLLFWNIGHLQVLNIRRDSIHVLDGHLWLFYGVRGKRHSKWKRSIFFMLFIF